MPSFEDLRQMLQIRTTTGGGGDETTCFKTCVPQVGNITMTSIFSLTLIVLYFKIHRSRSNHRNNRLCNARPKNNEKPWEISEWRKFG